MALSWETAASYQTALYKLIIGLESLYPGDDSRIFRNSLVGNDTGSHSGAGANGAIIGEYVCSGFIYSANVGWICLGSGSPANAIQYQNDSGSDFGVNMDGLGNLRGYAYGANIGWIVFESNGAPSVSLANGKLGGYAWSANCGWISLSNIVAFVQTDVILQGALAPDGLPVAWCFRISEQRMWIPMPILTTTG